MFAEGNLPLEVGIEENSGFSGAGGSLVDCRSGCRLIPLHGEVFRALGGRGWPVESLSERIYAVKGLESTVFWVIRGDFLGFAFCPAAFQARRDIDIPV